MPNDTVVKDSMIEGHTLRLQPAPSTKRALAAVIDMGIVTTYLYALFIIGAIAFVPLAVALAPLIAGFKDGSGDIIGLIAILIPVILALLLVLGFMHYFYINAEYKTGQTPGKKFMGLKVVSLRNGGGKMTLRQAITRDLARWYIDMLLFLPALIAMGLTKRRQRVGDLVADTMVVYNEKEEQEQTYLFLLRRDYEALKNAFGPVKMSTEGIERFLGFSNQYYLVGLPEVTASLIGQAQEWDAYLRRANPVAEQLGLDQNTLLRFFAEFLRRDQVLIQNLDLEKPEADLKKETS
jgi:uncharacterized RDD family membrane protein YckC